MFAKLTRKDNTAVSINPRMVEAVEPAQDGKGTAINCGARSYMVGESMEDVETALAAALLEVYKAKTEAARAAAPARASKPGKPSGAAEGGEGGSETH